MSSSLRRNHKRLRVVPRQVCRRRCPPLDPTRNPANPPIRPQDLIYSHRGLSRSQKHVLSWPCPRGPCVIGDPMDRKDGRSSSVAPMPQFAAVMPTTCPAETFHTASSGASPPEASPRKPSRRLPPPCAMTPSVIPAVQVLGTSQRQKRSSARQGRAHP